MTYDEAVAWLKGERSMANVIPSDEFNLTWGVRIAQADAAMMQQACLVLNAHKDDLLSPTIDERDALIRELVDVLDKAESELLRLDLWRVADECRAMIIKASGGKL